MGNDCIFLGFSCQNYEHGRRVTMRSVFIFIKFTREKKKEKIPIKSQDMKIIYAVIIHSNGFKIMLKKLDTDET